MKKHSRSSKKQKKAFRLLSLSGLGFSGWSIVVLSLAIITFLGSMLINRKKSFEAEGTMDAVTVQVLNGCGIRGAAESMSEALLPGDGSMIYDIIEKSDARVEAFDKTLVVDRRGSMESPGQISRKAEKVAERLGLDSDDVVLLKLDDNILDIDVTIIAGSDYESYVERLKKSKEEPL